MGRIRIGIILLVALLFGFMAYSIVKERQKYETSVRTLQERKTALSLENEKIAAKIEYFKKPENLLKEARSQFNFVAPGERVIILVPENPKATGTTQQKRD